MPERDQEPDADSNENETNNGSPPDILTPDPADCTNDTQIPDEPELEDPEDKWKRVWVFNRSKE